MKKVMLFLIVLFLLSNTADAQFIRIWEKSVALGNLPSWFSPTDDRERGIAYGAQSNEPRLYVISNLANPTVIILNALTGDSVGTLNTAGISGGIIALNDIETPGWGTEIYACNLTDDPTISPFKIYKWDDESASPQTFIIDSVSNFRLGDHLNFNRFFHYHFVLASPNTDKVVDYHAENGFPPYIRRVVTLSDGNMGSNASAAFNEFYPMLFDFGGYFVNSDGDQPKAYDTSGVLVSISSDTLISPYNNAIKYNANGTLCCDNPFYLTFNYNDNKAELVQSVGYPGYEFYWGSSASLGSNFNPENYGDVELAWRASDSLYVFVLGGNNGLGAYFANGMYTPVELTSFTASASHGKVQLNWSTATETNNSGFEIQRKQDNTDWTGIGFVEGNGTSTQQHLYSFIDENVSRSYYLYRLKQTDFDGSFVFSKEVEVDITSPMGFSLEQNYPNPFNPTTQINYSVPASQKVILKVYDEIGNEVATLVNEEKTAGTYKVEFDGSKLSSGAYLYQLMAGYYFSTKKMLLIK